MRYYHAFGLIIESDIPMEELLLTGVDISDVEIKKGEVPNVLENALVNTETFKVSKNEYLASIKEVGKFYVAKGKYILYEPIDGLNIEIIKLYLLGSCMGAILYQRGILPLHGSCIKIADKAVIITGASGAGKSTIAAALRQKGCLSLSDDVIAINFTDNELWAIPSYPGIKLWEDALVRLSIGSDKRSLGRCQDEYTKYALKNVDEFYNHPQEISFIFEVVPTEQTDVVIEEVFGAKKLELIVNNMFKGLIAEAMGLRSWYYKQCVTIAACTKIYCIKRPKNMPKEQEIAEIILMLTRDCEANSVNN
ncbi:MAG: hypothetical protein QM644_01260 [Mobilitalea sp.]